MRTRHTSGTTAQDALEAARRQLADRRPETLLLVQLLIEDDAFTGRGRMRLAGQLRLCADIPELAEGLGCSADTVDPGLMRAAAALLADAENSARI
jgi:hypothetical protein